MIHLESVSKYFTTKNRRKYICNDVTLTIPSGVNIGIIGPNGAGKTTLLRMLGKLDFPNSGKIITNKRISWPVALAGGFQGSLSARQNVRFVCQIYSRTPEEVLQKIQFVEEFAGLGDYFDMPIKTYSSGMKARVSFGLSMAFDFDYYLIDEALSVGDRLFIEKARAVMAEKKARSNFLLCSHSMGKIKSFCDAAILLNQGTLTYYDDVQDAIQAYESMGKLEAQTVAP